MNPLSSLGDAATNVISDLTAIGVVGTPQAQAAAQSDVFGVSQAGLNLGGFQIPTTTLVLAAIVIIALSYFADYGK